jgi:hypothetical protein
MGPIMKGKPIVAVLAGIGVVAALFLLPKKPALEATPEAFFRAHPITRPTVLLTIGLSGSGKTFWSRVGVKAGWEHIEIDGVIEEEVNAVIARGEVVPEIGAVPEKGNSEHFFLLRKRGHDAAYRRADEFLVAGKSFIWDTIGLNHLRDGMMERARQAGWRVWWLVFEPGDWKLNRFNLFLREHRGGMASFKEQSLPERCRRLDRMLADQREKLAALLKEARGDKRRGPDEMFFTRVPDLRGELPGGDPCP